MVWNTLEWFQFSVHPIYVATFDCLWKALCDTYNNFFYIVGEGQSIKQVFNYALKQKVYKLYIFCSPSVLENEFTSQFIAVSVTQ